MDAPLRQLISCPRCERQFDVGPLANGECVRCLCGETLRWIERAAHDPLRRRCPHCGAPCPAESRTCSFCRGEIQLDDRGLAEVCPACYARMLRGAHYCMECGLAIRPQLLHALPVGLACPRCEAQLRRRTLGAHDLIECSSCAGLWLSHEVIQRLVAQAESEDFDALDLPEPAPRLAQAAAAQGYIPCVACRERMQRRNFAGSSGVIVDVCGRHGVWFDHRELERVLEFVRQGGLRRARAREVERQEQRLRRAGEERRDAHLDGLLVEPRAARAEPELLDFLGGCGRALGELLRRVG